MGTNRRPVVTVWCFLHPVNMHGKLQKRYYQPPIRIMHAPEVCELYLRLVNLRTPQLTELPGIPKYS
eukprot:522618-Amphidinium_carterae.1